MSRRKLTVLGATGSIGRSTLDVARRHSDKLEVYAVSANRDAAALLDVCREFGPRHAVVGEAVAPDFERQVRQARLPTEVHAGAGALDAIAADTETDLVMAAIVGAAGLASVLAAVRAGKRVLVANKEPLVMAGALLMSEAARSGAALVPIDSEHNAIFQCLPDGFRCGLPAPGVRRIVLTASGGPFRDWPLERLAEATPEQAVQHPNWSMGPKISVDSATMMNKGLELIEAQRLFGVSEERIDVVMHPESVVHSMVEYIDGSTLAQLGQPDMRVPIANALGWPERWESGVEGLSLAETGVLNFAPADPLRFPSLGLAREALRAGEAMPNVLNAANEVAVDAFLKKRIAFTRITGLIGEVLDDAAAATLDSGATLEAILEVDAWARDCAQSKLGPAMAASAGRA